MQHLLLLPLLSLVATSAQQIAVGGASGCVVGSDTFAGLNRTELVCWGSFVKQGGTLIPPSPPEWLKRGRVHLAMTLNAACAIDAEGAVACWGDATDGALTPPPGVYRQITMGNWNCGTLVDGGLRCWGNNVISLQIPVGNFTYLSTSGGYQTCALHDNLRFVTCFGSAPVTVPVSSVDILSISTGYTHVCVLLFSGVAQCYGSNTFGESSPPIGNTFVQLTAGDGYTCGLRSDYTAVCFGVSTVVPATGTFVQLASAGRTVCGIRAQTWEVTCWGESPPAVPALQLASRNQLSIGLNHACVARSDGQLLCYGENGLGQLAYESSAVVSVAAANQCTCFVRTTGVVVCQGDNSAQQITNAPTLFLREVAGFGTTFCGTTLNRTVTCWGLCSFSRCAVPNGISTDSVVAVGGGGSCVLMGTSVVCWGSGTMVSSAPTATPLRKVVCGNSHCCGLAESDGSVTCWGSNALGQLNSPSGTAFLDVAAGLNYNCAVRSNSEVVCWGYSSNPANIIVPGDRWSAVVAGQSAACAISSNSTVHCWGSGLTTLPSVFASSAVALAPVGMYRVGQKLASCALGRFSSGLGALTPACSGSCAAGRFGQNRSADTSDQCTRACPPGQYCPQATVVPLPCPPGTFGSGEGLTTSACSGLCPVGFYCPIQTIAAAQFPCPAGRFGSTAGQSAANCSGECSAGFFCPASSASSQAVACSGSAVFCPAGSGQPQPVQAGYYSITTAEKKCEPGYYCSGGQRYECGDVAFFCEGEARLAPRIADPGFYTHGSESNKTQTGQRLCSPGFYCNRGVQIPCPAGSVCGAGATQPSGIPPGFLSFDRVSTVPCPAGSYCVDGEVHACVTDRTIYCPAGSGQPIPVSGGYLATMDGAAQRVCEAGTFCVGGIQRPCGDASVFCAEGSVTPAVVSVGYFGNNGSYSSAQVPCTAGQYCVGGQRQLCREGTFSASAAAAGCASCPAGQFQPARGATRCEVCAANTYQALSGQSHCLECPQFAMTPNGTARVGCTFCAAGAVYVSGACVACSAGQYSLNQTDCVGCGVGSFSAALSATACARCADGTYTARTGQSTCLSCAGVDGVVCDGGQLDNEAGVWIVAREDGSVVSVACPSGYCQSNRQCAAHRKPFDRNPLCAECEEGYSEWNGQCIECERPNGGIIFALLLVSWAYVLLTHVITNGNRKRSGATTTFFYFVQICYLETGPIAGWISWIGFFQFAPNQAAGGTCVLPLNAYETFALNAFVPFLFFAQLFLTLLIHWLLKSKLTFTGWLPYGRTGVVLFLWCFTQVASAVVQFLRCVEVPELNLRVVASSPAADCNSNAYSSWRAVAIVLLLVVLAVPIGMLVILQRYRSAFQTGLTDSLPVYVRSLGVLTEPYKVHFWFWEIVVILIRRLAFVGLDTALTLQPRYRELGFTYFHVVTLLVQRKLKPFLNKFDNQMETRILLLLTALSSLLIVTRPPYSVGASVCIFILFPLPTMALFAAILYDRLKTTPPPTKSTDAEMTAPTV